MLVGENVAVRSDDHSGAEAGLLEAPGAGSKKSRKNWSKNGSCGDGKGGAAFDDTRVVETLTEVVPDFWTVAKLG